MGSADDCSKTRGTRRERALADKPEEASVSTAAHRNRSANRQADVEGGGNWDSYMKTLARGGDWLGLTALIEECGLGAALGAPQNSDTRPTLTRAQLDHTDRLPAALRVCVCLCRPHSPLRILDSLLSTFRPGEKRQTRVSKLR